MTQTLTMNDTFKVGDKVFCKDVFEEFTGWIASIYDGMSYPYVIVANREDIGMSFWELDDLYEDDLYEGDSSEFRVFKLEHLTLLQDDSC